MGKAKPQESTNQQTTQTTPWGPALPAVTGLLSSAQTAYNATPKTSTYVDPVSQQLAGWSSATAAAPGLSTGVDALRGLATDQLSGKYLDPASNPWIKGVVDASIDPLRRELGHNIMTVGDAAQQAGAYGGDRQQLLAGRAVGDFNTSAMNTAANIYGTNYTNERQLQQGSGALLQQANGLALAPAAALSAVGNDVQNQAHTKLASMIDAPWAGLDRYASVLGTLAPYATTNITGNSTVTAAQPSGLASALQGGLGGASAGASFGPWGAAIGAGVGGLAGLFGG